ncbi:MAG: MFS transporter [Polyangiaceae bacterium]|nr:MFS transporter [Polyangiaceae bacterium]
MAKQHTHRYHGRGAQHHTFVYQGHAIVLRSAVAQAKTEEPNPFVPPADPPEPAAPPETEEKLSFLETVKTFPRSFWMCCTMEMWERLAYYGVRVVIPIYIAQADEPGGLHMSQAQKGNIFAWWALVQSLVPMVSGGVSDRYGYKNTIFISICLKVFGYLLMATQRSYGGFFFGCMMLALGTAIFKPGIQGTLAQSTSKKNSSVGWGLFYWLVNVGAAIGPPFAGYLHNKGWRWVFYGCAASASLTVLMRFTYKEEDSGADKSTGIWKGAKDTFLNIWDPRLLTIIALFSGFWMMLDQLWDLMPNFYADWTDSTPFVKANEWLPQTWLTTKDPRGIQLKQENALNLNALLVVLFVVFISAAVARMRVLNAIVIGFLIATCGTLVYGTSQSIYVLFIGIGLFSLGEMLTGPKKTEYFSLIAPKGKKALYLGYVNIPVAIGQAAGAKLAGWKYGATGEKAMLALRYLAEKTDYVKGKGAWDGDIEKLPEYVGVERAKALETLVTVLGKDAKETTSLLWETYQPYQVWYWFAVAGAVSLVGLLAFARASRKWKDMDV